MNAKLNTVQFLGPLVLRIAAIQLANSGKLQEAQVLNAVAGLAAAGRNVDAYMAEVADAMAQGKSPDTQELIARIEAASAELQADSPA